MDFILKGIENLLGGLFGGLFGGGKRRSRGRAAGPVDDGLALLSGVRNSGLDKMAQSNQEGFANPMLNQIFGRLGGSVMPPQFDTAPKRRAKPVKKSSSGCSGGG